MDESIKLIKNNDGKPFFLILWFYSVHTPIQAKEEKIKKYERKIKAMGLDKVKTFEEGEYFSGEHKKHLRVMTSTLWWQRSLLEWESTNRMCD